MDVLLFVNTHIKSSAFDFLTLKLIPHESTIFSRKGRHLLRAQTPLAHFKLNRFIKFDIDDCTDCIPCIWINQETSRHFSHRI
ncbi:hypothetical protein R3W88_008350 [Solanum pinnatisectum]|uniref:Uncharacterized protein n=1 Tax=Solanum pinnatisectum TaxID=50273 RepID=A0AAV9MAW6_9SOLN|nr:hypothetical protein R3W88_008350 [Solanum pinnatisectum]